MSRKPSFANLRDRTSPGAVTAQATTDGQAPAVNIPNGQTIGGQGATTGPASRQGRKQIAGFFSPEMSFAMHTLARRQGRSLQALMAEAFNDVLRKHGESPIGD
ncbi:ribbon-helix-helix domain-containing protein [Sphingomonas faeni]|uniref:ribbon-helix-helix domain-containing protein n=1 Tax=Sphingomonas faeni TaxID=185950 RepID=UPI00335CC235